MSQPIFSVKSDDKTPKAVVNLLPCRVHHKGPVDPVNAYWNPITAEDGTQVAFFRGRKLQGKVVDLPEQYRGLVMGKKDESKPPPDALPESNEEEGDMQPQVGTLQVSAEFDQMVVWDHENVVDATTNPHVRSMDEWLRVSEQVNTYSQNDAGEQK